ncbi:hypothetical protein CYMTET_20409, partial [Cymbomonas tetramitiformis]
GVYVADEARVVASPESSVEIMESVNTSTRTAPLTSGRCEEGYTGRLCMQCAEGYLNVNGNCYMCPVDYVPQLLFTVSTVGGVVAAWVFLGVYMAGNYTSLSILLMYLQIGSMLQGFNMGWPSSINTWITIQQIVNFDVDLISPQCIVTEYGFAYSYYLQLFLPPAVLGLNVARHEFTKYRLSKANGLAQSSRVIQTRLRRKLESSYNSKVATVLSFMEVVYHSLCIRSVQPWICDSMGGDLHYLAAAPDIECWKGEHIYMLVASVFTFFIYLMGIPVCFALILAAGHQKGWLADTTFMHRYGFMYADYELEWTWWILVIMLRRFVCAFVLVVFQSNPFLQSTLALIVVIAATTAHFFARPYVDSQYDLMESSSLVNLCILVIAGITFYTLADDLTVMAWTCVFFATLLLQMAFGVSIFLRDVKNQNSTKKAQKSIEGYLLSKPPLWNCRHRTYSHTLRDLAKMGHAEGSMGRELSEAEFVQALGPLDDGLPQELSEENAQRMFLWAQQLEQLRTAVPRAVSSDSVSSAPEQSAAGTVRRTETGAPVPRSEGCLTDEAGDGKGEKEKRKRKRDTGIRGVGLTVPVTRKGDLKEPPSKPPSVAAHLLLYSIAADYFNMLMQGGVRGIHILYSQLEGAFSVSIDEMEPLWSAGITNDAADPSTKRAMLECFVSLAGSGQELDFAGLHKGLMMFSGGELDVLHLLKMQGSDVASPQPDEAIRLCLRELCKDEGESADEHKRGNNKAKENGSNLLMKIRTNTSSAETAKDEKNNFWHSVTMSANLVMSQLPTLNESGFTAAEESEAGVFLAANESVVTLLVPEVLEDWVKNEPDKANLMVLHELGVMLNDMQINTVNPQMAIHGTQFESKFFNLLFSTFPYLIDWTLTADPEERENAKRFLDSLYKFGEADSEAISGTRCDAVFREACLAQMGYITLKQHKNQAAMLARQVCTRIIARQNALKLSQQQFGTIRLLHSGLATALPSSALSSLSDCKHVEENGKNQQEPHVSHQSMYHMAI